MISYYDVMMIDDHAVMNEPHVARRRRLEELVTCIRGRANIAKRKVVDFSSRHGPEKLRALLAHAFAQRWEGLVLKPSHEPYFNRRRILEGLPPHCWIKLKKDYIPGLGDTMDFAVVGAGYDPTRAAQLKCLDLKWTHFHIGCLRNKEQVLTKNAKPCFKVISAIEVNVVMAKHLNQHGQFCALPLGSLTSYHDPFVLDVAPGITKMNVVFRKPFVFDVTGAGFEKEPNRDYYSLRFPRAIKIHSDRDWKASTGFDELQQMARVARTVPEDTRPCVAEWMKQLDQVDRGTKGASVPWDLSDDDVETPELDGLSSPTARSTARRSTRRFSEVPPVIRMDTQEMTDKEIRLDSGKVVQRPPSQCSCITYWSESNLPTPPKSSPPHEDLISPARQPLSSLQSTNSTERRRRHSTEDAEDHSGERSPKRQRLSPPAAKVKEDAAAHARTRPSMNSKLPSGDKRLDPLPSNISSTNLLQQYTEPPPPPPSFLVPKLSAGAAEALNYREKKKRPKTNNSRMEPTSPDRQTTDNEHSSQEGPQSSTQQSLVSQWRLQPAEDHPPPHFPPLPNLRDCAIVLSPDVSGMPYLTHDLLLHHGGLTARTAEQVFGIPPNHNPHPDHTPKDNTIILIEARRHDPSLQMLKFLVSKVPPDGSQVFWVFDWRLVEDMFARGVLDGERLMGKRLVARFWYADGDGEGGLRWLGADGKVGGIPGEKVEESRGMRLGEVLGM